MVFKSRKNIWFPYLILGKTVLLIAIIFSRFIDKGPSVVSIIILLVMLIAMTWIFYTTQYEITNSELKYKSGFLNGHIDIHKIKEIVNGKTLWVGIKPATATKGLIIKYNNYDEIYISPKNNQTFINEILKIKPDIKITEAT